MKPAYMTTSLQPDPTQVAVRFREPAPHAMRLDFARSSAVDAKLPRYEIPGEKYTVYSVAGAGAYDADALPKVLDDLQKHDSVVRVTPVYRTGPNSLLATDRVVVGLRRGAARAIRRFEALGFEVVDQHESEYLVRLRENDDPRQWSAWLAEDPDVEYAEPDYVEYGDAFEPTAEAVEAAAAAVAAKFTAGDTLASAQWARSQVNADGAMELLGGAGSPAIRIAIVDAGVDRQHPDLAEAIAGVFDAVDEPPSANPQDFDSHGTACAGLAAAIPNNGQGIRGFGGGCSILAVRAMYTSGQPRRWKMSGFAIARGISWAVANGADVVSLSLFMRHPHRRVVNAIKYALTKGRNGKGCVVVAGTGNDVNGSPAGVKFPALLPGVIAVAATDEEDAPIQLGNGFSWGSAFGREVALAAPGTRHWTTDNTAKAGANLLPSPTGDYMDWFDGTSSATAVVAGAAGLVLSANPKLTAKRVREILCSTAEPVTTVTYVNGHNERVGTGRLNLRAAVEKALAK